MFVGIDVSKDRLDVHLRPSAETFRVARDGQGLEQLMARLTTVAAELVVLEATGGFEITVAASIAAAGLPLAVVNPAQIRAFARAIGRLAKTDRLDAELIARFAEQVRPEPRPVLGAQAQILAELVARRRQIVEMIGTPELIWITSPRIHVNETAVFLHRRAVREPRRMLWAYFREPIARALNYNCSEYFRSAG